MGNFGTRWPVEQLTRQHEPVYGPAVENLRKQQEAAQANSPEAKAAGEKLHQWAKDFRLQQDSLLAPKQTSAPQGPVTLLITPRPAERPRFSKFGGAYNSKRYSDYKKQLVELLKAKIALGEINPALQYAGIVANFYLPVPKSWTRKAKAAVYARPHRVKPDADNLLKACADAMTEAKVFADDGQVAQMSARKWYVDADAAPRIEVRLYTETDLYNQAF